MIANALGGKLDSNWALYSTNLSCKLIICSPTQFFFPSLQCVIDVWQNQEFTNLIISSHPGVNAIAVPSDASFCSATRSTFRRLPICRQAILVTARPETKPAKSETLLILTLLKIPDSNLLWHIRCADFPALGN